MTRNQFLSPLSERELTISLLEGFENPFVVEVCKLKLLLESLL